MFEVPRIIRMILNARNAAESRSLDEILASAKEIAEFLGYGPEEALLVAICNSVAKGDVHGSLINFGDFAVLLAKRFTGTSALTMANPEMKDEIIAMCETLQTEKDACRASLVLATYISSQKR